MSEFEANFKGKSEVAQPITSSTEGWSAATTLKTVALVVGGALLVGAAAYFLGDSSAFKEAASSTSLDHILANAKGAADWGQQLAERGAEFLANPTAADVALSKATGLLTASGNGLSEAAQLSYNQGVLCVNELVKPGAPAEAINSAVTTCAQMAYKITM